MRSIAPASARSGAVTFASASEVDRVHVWVVADLIGCAARHHRHRRPSRRRARPRSKRDVHVVLDEQQGECRRQRSEQFDEPLALTPRQAGCRFVEQHDLRIGRDRHADLELTALTVRQVGDLRAEHRPPSHTRSATSRCGIAQRLVAGTSGASTDGGAACRSAPDRGCPAR